MQIFDTFNSNKDLSLAFGFFDGMHLGHQAVIKSAIDFAKEHNKKSAVITFQDHPCCFFYHIQPKYIMTKHDKVNFLEKMGVDYLYLLKFDEYLAMMGASDYLREVIIKNFAPCAISTGFNHSFGAKKSGNVHLLCQLQAEFCYTYFEIPPVVYNNEVISSTRIREDLAIGSIEPINAMLGYNYFLEGTVIKGQQIGRTIGVKSANLVYPDNLVEIGRGVYKVSVEHDGKTYSGVANYGLRPTVTSDGDSVEQSILEVHILDFDKDIYGEKIKVTFLKRIRDEKKFNSLEELKLQIQEDISNSKD